MSSKKTKSLFSIIMVLVVTAMLSINLFAASGTDTSTGFLQGSTCTATLTLGPHTGTATSKSDTTLYRKSAAISITYTSRTGTIPFYDGTSKSVYNTISSVSAIVSIGDDYLTTNGTGSHYFEASNGYVLNLSTSVK